MGGEIALLVDANGDTFFRRSNLVRRDFPQSRYDILIFTVDQPTAAFAQLSDPSRCKMNQGEAIWDIFQTIFNRYSSHIFLLLNSFGKWAYRPFGNRIQVANILKGLSD